MSIVKQHLNQQAKGHSIIKTLKTNLIMFHCLIKWRDKNVFMICLDFCFIFCQRLPKWLRLNFGCGMVRKRIYGKKSQL